MAATFYQGSPSPPRPPSSTLSTVQALRKSLSVDSLVHFSRDPPPQGASSLTSPAPVHHDSQDVLPSPAHHDFQSYARSRGASLSSVEDKDHHGVESDAERSDPLNSPVDHYRRASLKTQDPSKPVIRGGELPLPSRTPIPSVTSSMSSILSVYSTQSGSEDVPRQHSLSSLHTFASRPTLPTESTGRIRSGSLGMIGSPSRRMLIHTTISAPTAVVTLLIIGTAGCGKSVVIKKGLRGHGLSEPTSMTAVSMRGISKSYSRRIGVIRNENSAHTSLHVIEVDVLKESADRKKLDWHQSLPAINGAIICYDSSDESSFEPIEGLLQMYRAMKLPVIVLACKSDLQRKVEPEKVLDVLQPYDVGLVEVAKSHEQGKDKMRRTFEWILKAVARERRNNRSDPIYRNPASPDVLTSPSPWESSRSILSLSMLRSSSEAQVTSLDSQLATIASSSSSIPLGSPRCGRSAGDLSSGTGKPRTGACDQNLIPETTLEEKDGPEVHGLKVDTDNDHVLGNKEDKEKERDSRPGQWATLDELLDKLLFLSLGLFTLYLPDKTFEDPAFITHFLLTYRKFATPRSVLLAMQKRMRQLDNPSGDPMFACFAQMRICHLLEIWIREYPHDFAVRGTAGALSALIKSIISKTYLLHYGSEFLPFLEMLPSLVDDDAAWAFSSEDTAEESDDSYSLLEDDESFVAEPGPSSPPPNNVAEKTILPTRGRERKHSLPLPLILGNSGNAEAETSEKQQIKDLVKLANEVLAIDSDEIAQEITRIEVKLFLDIKPRHWVQYTFISGKKDISDPITAFNAVSNHLADWVVSLILCHKTSRARVKQIEKFVDVAQKLRSLNNYSALRAFVAGINNATFPGDETMEQFKAKAPEQAKNLQSWDVLLQQIRSHRAYRLALRNSKGACIPALEVHMSDLIRAHEGNDDVHSSDPQKIHWGKFNMMGRFISSTVQCQTQCRISNDYNFPDRSAIVELLVKRPVMSDQMREARIAPIETDGDDYRPAPHSASSQPKDLAILRRLLFW